MNGFGHGIHVDRGRRGGKPAAGPQDETAGGILSFLNGNPAKIINLLSKKGTDLFF